MGGQIRWPQSFPEQDPNILPVVFRAQKASNLGQVIIQHTGGRSALLFVVGRPQDIIFGLCFIYSYYDDKITF